MKERPIIFSTPMVQAILDGRKTMTRRICRYQHWSFSERIDLNVNHIYQKGDRNFSCPYGVPGDQLWVKETFENELGQINYKANNPEVEHNTAYTILTKWKPSIFMPRTASRIQLLIKSIRVESLLDISNEDCIKEGYVREFTRPKFWFFHLWNEIYGLGSLEKNPWVWVIEFEKL